MVPRLLLSLHQVRPEGSYALLCFVSDTHLATTRVQLTLVVAPAELHGLSVKLTLEALVQLGVLPSADARYSPNVSRYYPHSIGHHLGIDVHDCPDLAHSEPLAAGGVFTIEPGLYFRPDDESVPKSLRGIGVRIEDDILIERDGPRVLTSHVPKDIDEVELMLAESHSSNESIVAQY